MTGLVRCGWTGNRLEHANSDDRVARITVARAGAVGGGAGAGADLPLTKAGKPGETVWSALYAVFDVALHGSKHRCRAETYARVYS